MPAQRANALNFWEAVAGNAGLTKPGREALERASALAGRLRRVGAQYRVVNPLNESMLKLRLAQQRAKPLLGPWAWREEIRT